MIVIRIAITPSLNASSRPLRHAAVCMARARPASVDRDRRSGSGAGARPARDVDRRRRPRQARRREGQPHVDRPDRPEHPSSSQAVARRLGLHPLVAEDIIESNERAKVELVDEVIHVVTFVLEREDDVVTTRSTSSWATASCCRSTRPSWDPDDRAPAQDRHRAVLERGAGPPPVGARRRRSSTAISRSSIGSATRSTRSRTRRRAAPSRPRWSSSSGSSASSSAIRHVARAQPRGVRQLTSREFDLIGEPNVFYFRDVYDHLIRLTTSSTRSASSSAGALEIYLSTINNNLSTIMKRLTGVTVILAGIGAVGGVFGMSEAATALSGARGLRLLHRRRATVVAAVARRVRAAPHRLALSVSRPPCVRRGRR